MTASLPKVRAQPAVPVAKDRAEQRHEERTHERHAWLELDAISDTRAPVHRLEVAAMHPAALREHGRVFVEIPTRLDRDQS